jgi:regulator of nucleoside diphosphate kinase
MAGLSRRQTSADAGRKETKMQALLNFDLRPEITVGEADHKQLTVLALAGIGHSSDAADDLLYEMERANVLPEAKVPAEVVRMGSTLTYRADHGERTVTLVYPAEADISQGKISVLTPIGTALIGLRKGQSIAWTARDGKRHALTLLTVASPGTPETPDDDDPGPLAA